MTHAERLEREAKARRLVMLRLRSGPATLEEIRPELKALGNFGRTAGCRAFLEFLALTGAIVSQRCRQRPTGPLVDAYRLSLRVCRVCGCDEGNACLDEWGEPCHWAESELCSTCVGKAPAGGKGGAS